MTTVVTTTIISPMEQYLIYPILSLQIHLNNVVFYLQMAAFISIAIAVPKINNTNNVVANWWGIQNESLYHTILAMVTNMISKSHTIYFPLLYTLFHIIQFSNQLGMQPYTSTVTVEQVMTLSLSWTLCIGIMIIGFTTHGLYLQAGFIPAGTPQALVLVMQALEIQAYLIKILSLGQRLAINLTTGHVLIKVIISSLWGAYLKGTSLFVQVFPLFQLSLFMALELLIAYQQAYIFVFIVCLTFKDWTS